MARSMVESPINADSSGSGLALFCATRINIRLKAIPAVRLFCMYGRDIVVALNSSMTYNSARYGIHMVGAEKHCCAKSSNAREGV